MEFEKVKELFPMRNYVSYKLKNAVNVLYEQNLNKKENQNNKLFKSQYKNLIYLSNTVPTCATSVEVNTCADCGTRYAGKINFCQNRLCPICARRRSLKYLSVLMPKFIDILENGGYINFLTLTIKDTKILSPGLNGLLDSWRYMIHDDKFSAKIFKHLFKGGIRNVEIKKGANSNDWHPHMHLLVVKDKPSKDFYYIKSIWENATAKTFKSNSKVGSVDIRGIKTGSGNYYKGFHAEKIKGKYQVDSNIKEGLMRAVVETVKYVTKFSFEDYSASDLNELVNNIHGRRFMNAFGCMYNIQKELDEETDEDEEALKNKICKKCGCTNFFIDYVLSDSIGYQLESF